MKNEYEILLETMNERNHKENLGTDGRIIIKWALRKGRRCGLYSPDARWRLLWLSYELGNESYNSIKGNELLHQLSNYQVFKDSAPWI